MPAKYRGVRWKYLESGEVRVSDEQSDTPARRELGDDVPLTAFLLLIASMRERILVIPRFLKIKLHLEDLERGLRLSIGHHELIVAK